MVPVKPSTGAACAAAVKAVGAAGALVGAACDKRGRKSRSSSCAKSLLRAMDSRAVSLGAMGAAIVGLSRCSAVTRGNQ